MFDLIFDKNQAGNYKQIPKIKLEQNLKLKFQIQK